MKLLVIFNPQAANGRAKKLLPLIRDCISEHELDTGFLFTNAKGAGTRLVAEADLTAYDGVIAVGGDGSVFDVVNGLYRHSAEDRIPIGVIPIGTGNAFSRDLGLEPGEWKKAIGIIARNQTRQIDVGHVKAADREYYFLNIVGMGFAVDAGITAKKLKFLGNGAYTLATLWRVLGLKSYPLQIELDGEPLEQENVFVEVSNSRYTGTTFLIAPGASLDDGLLDVTLLRKLGRLRLLKLFPTIYSGRHIEFEEVVSRQAGHIRIVGPPGMLLAPDGEFAGHTPVDIRCIHKDLEIFT